MVEIDNMNQEMGLLPIKKYRKYGSENFHNNENKLGYTLLDFWRWSASDLVSNSLRGKLAEFIIAQSLCLVKDAEDSLRSEWSPYDLKIPNGVKIEVKSAAYIQSWFQKEKSKISFDIKKTRELSEETAILAEESKRQAHIYVFCLLKHEDGATIDPLNLDQWEFYILPASLLDKEFGDQKRISLKSLKEVSLKEVEPNPVLYKEIHPRIEELAKRIQGGKS
jgi:ADP-heptose:LPS heptosyltransferase